MPKNVAQLTGMLVTVIVSFGADFDLAYAMLLGLFAGELAALLISLSEVRPAPVKE